MSKSPPATVSNVNLAGFEKAAGTFQFVGLIFRLVWVICISVCLRYEQLLGGFSGDMPHKGIASS